MIPKIIVKWSINSDSDRKVRHPQNLPKCGNNEEKINVYFYIKTIIISKISSYSCNDHKKFPFLSIIDLLFKSFRGIILNSNSVCFQSIKNGLLVARSDQYLQGIILNTKIPGRLYGVV